MLRELPKSLKATLIIIVLVLIGGIIYFVYSSTSRAGKIEVTINAVPSDAHIILDGNAVNPGKVYLTAGNHTVKASKDGFKDFSSNSYINTSSSAINIELVPVSDDAVKWANDHQQQYWDLEGEAGTKSEQEGEAFRQKNPIVNDLPTENFIYTIGYRADTSDPSGNSIIITIDAAPGYRNGAIQAIKDLGYDPTQFKFEFKDYTNPFSL